MKHQKRDFTFTRLLGLGQEAKEASMEKRAQPADCRKKINVHTNHGVPFDFSRDAFTVVFRGVNAPFQTNVKSCFSEETRSGERRVRSHWNHRCEVSVCLCAMVKYCVSFDQRS